MARGSEIGPFSTAHILITSYESRQHNFHIESLASEKCVCGTGYFDATHAFAIQLLTNTGQKVLNQAFFFD